MPNYFLNKTGRQIDYILENAITEMPDASQIITNNGFSVQDILENAITEMPDASQIVTGNGFSVQDILNAIYPVGAIYTSTVNVSPAKYFGGTWEQIQGRFLFAADSSYSAGSTGGEATHTLTVSEMPSHHHSQYGQTWDWGNAKSTLEAAVSVSAKTSGTSVSANHLTSVQGGEGYANSLNEGGGAAHNNMPPYLAVYMWKRTA